MNETLFPSLPPALEAIEKDTQESGFTMPSERKTGSLLKSLASSKPGGHFLELGTGTGLSTAWILAGMNDSSSLVSADNDESVLTIAKQHLGNDPRITFYCGDGEYLIKKQKPESCDLIFADAWPGKYYLLDETLNLLKIGGFYIIDDMTPQPNWPEGHDVKAAKLLETLKSLRNLSVTQLNWATGILICSRLY